MRITALGLLLLAGCHSAEYRMALDFPCVRVDGVRIRSVGEQTRRARAFGTGIPLANMVLSWHHGKDFDAFEVEGIEVEIIERGPWAHDLDDWRRLENPTGLVAPVSFERPADGAQVWLVGYQREGAGQTTVKRVCKGRVIHAHGFPDDIIAIKTARNDLKGFSGGPILVRYLDGMVAVGLMSCRTEINDHYWLGSWIEYTAGVACARRITPEMLNIQRNGVTDHTTPD